MVVYSRMIVPGPDLDPGLLAPILEILRGAAEDRPVPDAHVLGQAHVALEPGARTDPAAVADADLVAHDHPRSDLHPLAELRGGVDDCGRVNDGPSPVDHARHHLRLGNDVAVHVAIATIRHVRPRF